MADELSQSALNAILNAINDGVIVVDASARITLFNRAAQRITGFSEADVIGHPVRDFIENTRLPHVMESGQAELNQIQRLSFRGQPPLSILTSRYPLMAADGSPEGAIAVFRDISEIQDLTETVCDLRQASTLLSAVLDAAGDAISVADEHGNTIMVNPAYTRITGLTREAVINKPVTVDIAEGESMHMQVLRTGKPVRNVPLKVGPLGRDVLVNVAPIVIDGRIRGSTGVIHDVSEIKRLTSELSSTKSMLRHLRARYTWDDIIGHSVAMERARLLAAQAARTSATVLLFGESGTGKELFAHAIHNDSARRDAQFIRVNCSAIAEGLLEAELFGYEEGAFTGASKGGHKGYFEEAAGGTIFLDEVGEIGISLQSKLLRVLQEREFQRVGGTTPLTVDIRIIAATNRNLAAMVREGLFREDLYYRLNVLPIEIVPLRSRPEDIPLIATHLLGRLNQEYHRAVERISDEALDLLQSAPWPGNIRELINMLGRAMLNMHHAETLLEAHHIAPLSSDGALSPPALPIRVGAELQRLDETLRYAERRAIEAALSRHDGNRQEAAQSLGISIRSLYYKLSQYGL